MKGIMQGKTEPKPEIQDEDHLEDSTTSRDFPETDIDNNFGSNIQHDESADVASQSYSSSPSNSIPESSLSGAEIAAGEVDKHFPQEPETGTSQEEEENCGPYSYSRQQPQHQQPRVMTDPVSDTTSNCESEPPVEGRAPSSLDELESTEGEYAYLVNRETVNVDSLKKQLNQLSNTKENPDVANKLSPMEKENRLLKEQLKNSKEKLRNFAENSLLTQEDHEKEIVVLKKQYSVEIENCKQQLKELEKKNVDFGNQIEQSKQAGLAKDEAKKKMEEDYKQQVNELMEDKVNLEEQFEQSKQAGLAKDEAKKKMEDDYEQQVNGLMEDKVNLAEQLEQSKRDSLTMEKEIKDLETRLNQSLKKMTTMKEDHREEVAGLTRSKETLIKKNSQLQKSMVNSDDVSDESTSSSTTTNDDELSTTSLNTSSCSVSNTKSYDTPTYFCRSDSKLATTYVRFVDGMVNFIEGQLPNTFIYNSYTDWYGDMVSKMQADIIYRSERHIFLKREFPEPLTAADRRLSFTSLTPRDNLSFGKIDHKACKFTDHGWPADTDYFLVLHPDIPKFKELIQLSERDEQGNNYYEWSAANVKDDYFYSSEDEHNEKMKTYILCAYKKEEKQHGK